MRVRKREIANNLDALLDTLANVVGILIMLLLVTEITVGDALERTERHRATYPDVTQQTVAAAQANLLELTEILDVLRARWAELELTSDRDQIQLDDLRVSIARLRSELAEPLDAKKLPADLNETIAARRAEVARLEDELKAAQAERDSLRARLADDLGSAERPAIARLPDPKPAPQGAEPLIFFCRYGRIMYVDAGDLGKALNDGIREALAASGGQMRIDAQDRRTIKKYFDAQRVGWSVLRWKFADQAIGTSFYATVAWESKTGGEPIADVRKDGSKFREVLAAHSPKRNFLQFIVWGDSFSVYLQARQIAQDLGYSAGWGAYGADEEYQVNLFGSVGTATTD